MSKLLKKAESSLSHDALGRFEVFNLMENPFPPTPFVNKDSEERKYNGSIYEKDIRSSEYKLLADNFLKPPLSEPSHLRLGFILDTSFIGRGNGKSAFLVNLYRDINDDYCLDISDQKNKCFAIYFSPEPSGKIKTFEKFVDALFDAIYLSNIIDISLASVRLTFLNGINSDIVDKLIQEFGDDDGLVAKINNNETYNKNGWPVYHDVLKRIKTSQEFKDVSPEFPFFKSFSSDGTATVKQKDFLEYYKTLKKGQEQFKFIFTDLVYFFEAAGYNGAFILVDDFERIPDFQSASQKKDFLSQLRSVLFDGLYRNSKIGFFNFIFALHAGVPRLIQEAWGLSGMEQRVSLDPKNANKQIIRFEQIDTNHAILLIKKYLNEYRIDHKTQEKIGLYPFSEGAVKLMAQKAQLNASKILQLAYSILDSASTEKVDFIDENFVKKILGSTNENNFGEGDYISTGLSDIESVDLAAKANSQDKENE